MHYNKINNQIKLKYFSIVPSTGWFHGVRNLVSRNEWKVSAFVLGSVVVLAEDKADDVMWKVGLCYQSWRVFFPLNKANRSLLQFASCLASSPGTEMTFSGRVSPVKLRHHRERSREKTEKDLLFSQSTDSSPIKSLASSCNMTALCCLFSVWQTSNMISLHYSFLHAVLIIDWKCMLFSFSVFFLQGRLAYFLPEASVFKNSI